MRGLDQEAPVERIRRATRDALVNLVDFAIGRQVAFVLLAGDLYDGNWKDWRTGRRYGAIAGRPWRFLSLRMTSCRLLTTSGRRLPCVRFAS